MIIIEADERYDIFSDSKLCEQFEQILKNHEKRYRFSLLRSVFSGTMAVIFIRISDIPTAKIMQSALTGFSVYTGRLLGITGKKFKRRYTAYPIKEEALDKALALDIISLQDPAVLLEMIRRKGRRIDQSRHKLKGSTVREVFSKVLFTTGLDMTDRDVRNTYIRILRKHTILTNRQIANMENVTESLVSKILSKETQNEKQMLIETAFTEVIDKKTKHF